MDTTAKQGFANGFEIDLIIVLQPLQMGTY
jgi:hypothetical protein